MIAETTDLRPNHPISRVIKGGWQLAGDHGSVDAAAAIRDMEAFLDAGITTFDCADIYTGVEEMIGTFIADIRRRRGASVAQRVCVHTKLVPDLGRLPDLRPDEVVAIIDRSLKRLQVEQLDLVQFFWWDIAVGAPTDALSVLKDEQAKGKIRNLGVTNWDIAETAQFIEAGFDLVSTQVQYSVLDPRPRNGLTDWAEAHDIRLLCYGTLAGGFLTEPWLGAPDPGFTFENRSLVKYRLIIDEFGPWARFQELLRALKAIGDKRDVGVGAVATRYVLDQPQVAAAIVGARYARHLPRMMEAFGWAFDDEDRAALAAVLDKADGPTGPVYGLERDRAGRHGRIMKYNLNTKPDDAVLGAADA